MSFEAPEHWLSFSAPENWYTLRYPPSWSVTTGDTETTFTPPDGEQSLIVTCHWREQPLGLSDEVNLLLQDQLAGFRASTPDQSIPARYPAVRLQGSVPGSRCRWWERWFGLGPRVPLVSWVIHLGRLTLLGRLLQLGEPDPERTAIVNKILQTVELSRQPADPPAVFERRVLALAQEKFPNLPSALADRFQLTLGGSTVNLLNFYRAYSSAPRKFEEILVPALTTVVQMQHRDRTADAPPLEAVRERIMPMLYPVQTWTSQLPQFAAEPWIAGLTVLYVVDEAEAYWFIPEDLMSRWEISQDELHTLAIENLERYWREREMELTGLQIADNILMLLPRQTDAYNTVRLLSPSFRQRMQEELGAEFVVGVPGRDYFVAAGIGHPEVLDRLQHLVLSEFGRIDHPLSDRLLLVSSDGVSEFVPSES